MVEDYYCDICGNKMKRKAKCEFSCKLCDNTLFDWSLQYGSAKEYEEINSDFERANLCRGGELLED